MHQHPPRIRVQRAALRPPLLTDGARVALVAPAGPLRGESDLQRAVDNVRSFGWDPIVSASALGMSLRLTRRSHSVVKTSRLTGSAQLPSSQPRKGALCFSSASLVQGRARC